MRIVGKLKDDIATGNAVLFLGAGASRCCGMHDAVKLAMHIYQRAGSPVEYKNYSEDLSKLVSKLDKDPMFTRRWVNTTLNEYFLDAKKYTNLEFHKALLSTHWKAIFTTNYDIALELAEYSSVNPSFRLLPITDPKDYQLLTSSDNSKVRYFKIHGCCRDLEQHPSNSMPLVITQKDFQESISRNKSFMEELRRLAYDSSIIFIGFQAQLVENNFIIGSISEAYRNISQAFQQNFTPFAILKDVDADTKEELEDININVLDGTFEAFVEEVAGMAVPRHGQLIENVVITTTNKTLTITRSEFMQLQNQFLTLHDDYYSEKVEEFKGLDSGTVMELWKSLPSDLFLATDRYIRRSCYHEVMSALDKSISRVWKDGSPQIIVLEGERASGKSVLAKQIAQQAFCNKKQPVIILNPDANFTILDDNGLPTNVSGWDGRLIDKFLSPFYSELEDSAVKSIPVIIADHLSHKQYAIDHLVKYLENHGKPCILVITLCTEEWLDRDKDRLLQLYKHTHVKIPHKLYDPEIDALFDKVANDHKAAISYRENLIDRAKGADGERDLLFILYMWFDNKFRRLEEIIIEEASKLEGDLLLKNLFVAIGVFHQYNFKPRASLCAEAVGINITTYNDMRVSPLFKHFIDFDTPEMGAPEYAASRHSQFSRKIVGKFVPERDDQVEIMRTVLAVAKRSDLQFCRNFLNYVYRYGTSFSVDQVSELKVATERYFTTDSVLNHQYAAYLIRENTRPDEARYYLELALKGDSSNSAIIHTIGNLCFSQYRAQLEAKDIKKAMEYYDDAKSFFERSRTLRNSQDEHSYFTDIDMMRYRIDRGGDSDEQKVLLKAESHALTFEALKVVPHERQVLLKRFVGECIPFKNLNDKHKEIIRAEILSGNASPLLLEYYCNSIIQNPTPKGWRRIKSIVNQYDCNTSPAMVAVLGNISKQSFVVPASIRFEKMRQFYDKIVSAYDDKTSFASLAEYIKTLWIDAIVLGKFDFLRSVTSDVISIFRDSQPRFLTDEFILENRFYEFDPTDESACIRLFTQHSKEFFHNKYVKRFSRLVDLNRIEKERYIIIEMDPISRYFIRGIRKEIANRAGKYELSFIIKYTYEGLRATDFRA